MILFLVNEWHIYSMGPGDSLYFEEMVEPPGGDRWVELLLSSRTGENPIFLISLEDKEVEEFRLRLIACLQAGKNDHTLLIDLEGLLTLTKGRG